MNKRLIIYITLVLSILLVAFLSQQSYMQDVIKKISPYISKYGGASLLGGLGIKIPAENINIEENNSNTSDNNTETYKLNKSGYNLSNTDALETIDSSDTNKVKLAIPSISDISQKVTDGLKSGGEVIANTINSTKENISTAEKNIVNYFSGISDAIQGKENVSENNQCQTNQ